MQRFAVQRRAELDSESRPGGTRLAGRNGARAPMARAVRAAILTVCALLWLSGAMWLVLHLAVPGQTEFGPLPNAWEPVVLRVHGLLAVGGVFLLGWIAGGHLIERWGGPRNRLSGFVLASCAVLLVLSGYALYYTTGTAHELASWTHECLGIVSALAALVHWWRIPPAHASPKPPERT